MHLNRYLKDEALLKENDKANYFAIMRKYTFFFQNMNIGVDSLYAIPISIYLKNIRMHKT